MLFEIFLAIEMVQLMTEPTRTVSVQVTSPSDTSSGANRSARSVPRVERGREKPLMPRMEKVRNRPEHPYPVLRGGVGASKMVTCSYVLALDTWK